MATSHVLSRTNSHPHPTFLYQISNVNVYVHCQEREIYIGHEQAPKT